ncbi:uncharacterized protein SCODWIG_02853 [Saccharomycodes ludwigii]|uniref:Cytochrome b5 heme-binding domain-containing protein n=1 Tax=Saccharomycodes ludwigii TaxID=36035 RepID=A0A376B8V6_9ASCO|nr:hypothetical protein SCDLUD_005271 [Saccharomycodes ludwigii]KAH3898925.1 hypothetical protein SCDLUD_005271 [Saccharomycodes ludwigii]SSD61092.1 uncharacterized protein SCODWIG_02853 [Saccharomycodes ludwigii]
MAMDDLNPIQKRILQQRQPQSSVANLSRDRSLKTQQFSPPPTIPMSTPPLSRTFVSPHNPTNIPSRSPIISSSERQPMCSTLPIPPANNINSTSIKNKRRQKTVLLPGHSALDWADLQIAKNPKGLLVLFALLNIRNWEQLIKDNLVYETSLIAYLRDLQTDYKKLLLANDISNDDILEQLFTFLSTNGKKFIPVLPWTLNPFLKISREELKQHVSQHDCWCSINGKVYCISSYLNFHPGGVNILMKNCAGKDATAMFNKYHRWVSYDKLLQGCFIGILK